MNPQPKKIIYRNRRMLNLAHRVNDCQFQIVNVCQGYSAHGCEPAHSNHEEHGHGTGIKAGDDYVVASCRKCHLYYDAHLLPKDQEFNLFMRGRNRTMALYQKNKWLAKIGYPTNEVYEIKDVYDTSINATVGSN